MGELISMQEYLERKVTRIDTHQVRLRMASIAVEIALLQSEHDRLESVLVNSPDDIA